MYLTSKIVVGNPECKPPRELLIGSLTAGCGSQHFDAGAGASPAVHNTYCSAEHHQVSRGGG